MTKQDLRELYHGTLFAEFALVALVDRQRPDSFPRWPRPVSPQDYLLPPQAIFGPSGVAVRTAPKAKIEVTVLEGHGSPGGKVVATGEITVGAEGLEVTDAAASDPIEWPAGRTSVRVYTEVPRGDTADLRGVEGPGGLVLVSGSRRGGATRVIFVIGPAP